MMSRYSHLVTRSSLTPLAIAEGLEKDGDTLVYKLPEGVVLMVYRDERWLTEVLLSMIKWLIDHFFEWRMGPAHACEFNNVESLVSAGKRVIMAYVPLIYEIQPFLANTVLTLINLSANSKIIRFYANIRISGNLLQKITQKLDFLRNFALFPSRRPAGSTVAQAITLEEVLEAGAALEAAVAAEEEAIDGFEGEGGEKGEVEMTAVASGSGGDLGARLGAAWQAMGEGQPAKKDAATSSGQEMQTLGGNQPRKRGRPRKTGSGAGGGAGAFSSTAAAAVTDRLSREDIYFVPGIPSGRTSSGREVKRTRK
jgi:hypothetical protein